MKREAKKNSRINVLEIAGPSFGLILGAAFSWLLINSNLHTVLKDQSMIFLTYIVIPFFFASVTAFFQSFLGPRVLSTRSKIKIAFPTVITYWLVYWLLFEFMYYRGRVDLEYIGFALFWYCIFFLPSGVFLMLSVTLFKLLGERFRRPNNNL